MSVKLTKVEPTALVAAEVAYLGSFILDPNYEREKDFYSLRTKVQAPEDMHDPMSAALMEAITRLYHTNEPTTVENLCHIMITEGLVTPETPGISGEAQAWTELTDMLNYYSFRGAKKFKEFRNREKAVFENWRNDKLSPQTIARVAAEAAKTSSSSLEIALAVRNYADSLLGQGEVQAQTSDWETQERLFTDIPAQNAEMVGKPRFTFPPHWNLNGLIPVIKPGEKIVLSGGTGDGKSAMSMQFAEWACLCGKNVLVIHMEDTVDTILMRQTVRWIGGTLEELEKGDPKGRMSEMKELRKKWIAARGGSLTYKYLAGNSIALIIEHIKETARFLETEGKHLDVVVMDYFQKVDFDSGVKPGSNYVNIATAGAEELKIIAQRLKLTMMVVSQETSDGNGGKHTAWTKALEQKPQIYISLTRQEIRRFEDEEWVVLPGAGAGGKDARVSLAKVGDRSCWVQVHVKKANNSRQGIVWLFFEGPRFRAFDADFMTAVERHMRDEFDVPVLTPADKAFFDMQEKRHVAYQTGYRTLKNPEQRKREKAEAQE